MSDLREPKSQSREQPGPGVARLFAGMVMAPFAWALEVLLGYALAAQACYPADVALAAPAWSGMRCVVAGSSLALWALLLVGCAIAWANWRATRHTSNADSREIIQSGAGRTRFMALCGVLVSGLFAIGLVFTSVGIFWVPSCGP